MSIGYTCLVLCLTELTSITNFAGGIYGYSRCSIGPMYGFLFGISELLQNNFFTLSNMDTIATAITLGFDSPHYLEPFWVLGSYLLFLAILTRGGSFFWYSMGALSIFTVLVLAYYFVGTMSLSESLYDHRSDRATGFVGQGTGFMTGLVYAAWFYCGVECVIVTGADISNGTQVLPKVMLTVIMVLVVLCALSVSVVYLSVPADQPIDLLLVNVFPLSVSFTEYLHISESTAALLILPASISSALGFLFTSKHTLHAMSLSGMVSPWFRPFDTSGKSQEWRALTVSITAQYAIYLVMQLGDLFSFNALFSMTILGCCGSYIGVFLAYLIFKSRFPGMERGITIPGGKFIAYLGVAVFSFVFVSVIGFHVDERMFVIPAYLLCFCGSIVYYYRVAEKRQFFSPEEQQKFMKAYILNCKFLSVFLETLHTYPELQPIR